MEREAATQDKTEYGWLRLPQVLREIARLAEAESAGLWYPDGDGKLRLCALWGGQELSDAAFDPGEGLCGTACGENAVFSADLVEDEAAVLALDPEGRAAAAVPVSEDGEILGVLHVSANRVSGLAGRAEAALAQNLQAVRSGLRLYCGKSFGERPVFAALRDVSVMERDGNGLRAVLSHVSLTLHEGEFLAVCGGRCSGKSVLCSVAAALEVPDAGTYFRGEKDLFRLSETQRRKFRLNEVGYISAEGSFLQDLTVRENLLLLSQGNRDKAEDALTFSGLAEHARSFPAKLSLFERRRAELAGARMKAVSLLVADEPEADLGDCKESFLQAFGFCANEGQRCTLLAVSTEETAAMAHRVIGLQEGAVCSMVLNPKERT